MKPFFPWSLGESGLNEQAGNTLFPWRPNGRFQDAYYPAYPAEAQIAVTARREADGVLLYQTGDYPTDQEAWVAAAQLAISNLGAWVPVSPHEGYSPRDAGPVSYVSGGTTEYLGGSQWRKTVRAYECKWVLRIAPTPSGRAQVGYRDQIADEISTYYWNFLGFAGVPVNGVPTVFPEFPEPPNVGVDVSDGAWLYDPAGERVLPAVANPVYVDATVQIFAWSGERRAPGSADAAELVEGEASGQIGDIGYSGRSGQTGGTAVRVRGRQVGGSALRQLQGSSGLQSGRLQPSGGLRITGLQIGGLRISGLEGSSGLRGGGLQGGGALQGSGGLRVTGLRVLALQGSGGLRLGSVQASRLRSSSGLRSSGGLRISGLRSRRI